MSEEKDAATLAAEADSAGAHAPSRPASSSRSWSPRPACRPAPRRTAQERVLGMLDWLPPAARAAIQDTYARTAGAPTLRMPAAGSGA